MKGTFDIFAIEKPLLIRTKGHYHGRAFRHRGKKSYLTSKATNVIIIVIAICT